MRFVAGLMLGAMVGMTIMALMQASDDKEES